jgi:hypothetical protein
MWDRDFERRVRTGLGGLRRRLMRVGAGLRGGRRRRVSGAVCDGHGRVGCIVGTESGLDLLCKRCSRFNLGGLVDDEALIGNPDVPGPGGRVLERDQGRTSPEASLLDKQPARHPGSRIDPDVLELADAGAVDVVDPGADPAECLVQVRFCCTTWLSADHCCPPDPGYPPLKLPAEMVRSQSHCNPAENRCHGTQRRGGNLDRDE